WGTFDLAVHAWDEPAERLIALAPSLDTHLLMPMLGAPIEPSRVEGVETWWRAISTLERRVTATDDTTERLIPIGDPID
ncbi:MAG: hypothetical protein DRH30_07770, partial [Deltaproteobacteria bacterium]